MSKHTIYWPALLVYSLLVYSLTSGCALTSKASPLPLRFFSPTSEERATTSSSVAPSTLGLRLGRVESAAHIEQRIAFRKSSTELGYYQGLRWTESPEYYVRDRLATALFNERAVTRIISGTGPTLDVELSAFEELQFGRRRARIALRFVLRDERNALFEQLIVEEQPLLQVTGGPPEDALPEAMAAVLSLAVSKVADRVVAHLGEPPVAP
jgi:cholesterol transport system auxiliary component